MMANNKLVKRGRPTKLVADQRMLEVVDMLLDLKTRKQIYEFIFNTYGVGTKSSDYLITQAYKVIKENYQPDKEAVINTHISKYYEIAGNAGTVLDSKSQIAALQAVEKLLGLHKPDVAIQQNTLNLDLKDMTVQDLKDLLG